MPNSVRYAGSGLIPGPQVNIRKIFDTSDDGTRLGSTFGITVRGEVLAFRGSPSSSGTFHITDGYPTDETIAAADRLSAILRKQEAIRQLFAMEGQKFEIRPNDVNANSIYFYPRIKNPVEFPQGPWFEKLDYSIEMEADIIYGALTGIPEDNFQWYISKGNEEWQIDPTDETNRAFKLTHVVNAVGKRHYSTSGTVDLAAWQQARGWVQGRMGFDASKLTSTGVFNNVGFYGYNRTKSERLDELAGTYGITESWFCFNATGQQYPAFEQFTVDTRTDEVGRNRVSINGSIQGLEVEVGATGFEHATPITKWAAASGYFLSIQNSIQPRAQNLAGVLLNPSGISSSVTKNHFAGTINYAYEYDDRPNPSVANAISEVVTIQDDHRVDKFAEHFVLGRYAGPLLQSVQASGARRRSVSIELVMRASNRTTTTSKPNTDSIVTTHTPSASTRFLERDSESWTPNQGRYSRNVGWVYEV